MIYQFLYDKGNKKQIKEFFPFLTNEIYILEKRDLDQKLACLSLMAPESDLLLLSYS